MGLNELQKIQTKISVFSLMMLSVISIVSFYNLVNNRTEFNTVCSIVIVILLVTEILYMKLRLWKNKIISTIILFLKITACSYYVVDGGEGYMNELMLIILISVIIRMLILYDFMDSYVRRVLIICSFLPAIIFIVPRLFSSYGKKYEDLFFIICLISVIILFIVLVIESLADVTNDTQEKLFEQRRLADSTKEANAALQVQQEKINKANELLGLQKLKLESAYQKMHDMAIRDRLTGIYNRGHLNQIFGDLCVEAASENKALSVALFDIDHFKLVNDTYGHLFGDAVIVAIAHISQEVAEKYKGIATRYGGEEFVIVFPQKDIETSKLIVEEMKQRISEFVLTYNETPVKVHVSVGVTSYPETCNEPLELLNHADWAMYYSKKNGRNRITIDSDEVREAVRMK